MCIRGWQSVGLTGCLYLCNLCTYAHTQVLVHVCVRMCARVYVYMCLCKSLFCSHQKTEHFCAPAECGPDESPMHAIVLSNLLGYLKAFKVDGERKRATCIMMIDTSKLCTSISGSLAGLRHTLHSGSWCQHRSWATSQRP